MQAGRSGVRAYVGVKILDVAFAGLNGIQEVSGSFPLISTKKLRNLRISELFSLLLRHKSSDV